ncbi:hypothetical protein Tco_1046256 [Tanacetum coccineum]
MADVAVNDRPKNVFVQGASYVVGESGGLSVVQGSERVSSYPNDVVVSLSAEEKDSPFSIKGGACAMSENTCYSELGAN